ncbi:hypothetical protein [Staphylococcus ratti]|uniref:Cytosolic protein n=1 Tax=Staphylococcus ratti TaxID=2892440 RepID=A0ABY3PD78_9STAP|nr:hypothetical protein [Staphylococcus ratti]UEX90273.1 hypothetical protein LN051_00955 [Staphylococcus ratti]
MNELKRKIESIEDEMQEALHRFDKNFDVLQDYKHSLRRDIEKDYDIFHSLQQKDTNLHNYQHEFEYIMSELEYDANQQIKVVERKLQAERDHIQHEYQQKIKQIEIKG